MKTLVGIAPYVNVTVNKNRKIASGGNELL
jgi:hypothetical protein